ncbi:Polynucleotide 5'-hydroxyl-kinase grc3 [Vanrija albida]|uniref:Polynucleotide 5'-hydroxyl-kinase GRC3 n=1 Tax=Vanrija albida TaxID=181172 RepID=A0ABR3QEM3_9TREE
MSALAARRAAQAALSASQPSSPAPAQKVPEPARKATPQPESPEVESAVLSSDAESEASEPAPRTSKRRKVNKEAPKATPKAATRYYAAPAEEEQPKLRKKERRFSFSAPNDDDSSGSDGEEEEDAGQDDPMTPWSGAPSPRAGPSRLAQQPALDVGRSTFVPQEGVNIHKVGEKALKAAGVETPGPAVVVSLGEEDSLMVAGTFTVTPLQQSISLLSATIRPSVDAIEAYPVYAPTSHPVPVLTAQQGEDAEVSPLLASLSLPKKFETDASRSIFLIQELRTGVEGLRGDVVPGFSNIWLDDKGTWGLRGVHLLTGSFYTPVYPHVNPTSWRDALDSLDTAETQDQDDDDLGFEGDSVPVVLVKGPKRSGKSSLARASLNRLLESFQRVAWLESDLGQGEFGCGGVVGLWVLDQPVLGPSFTHPRVPVKAHYLGEVSPQSCPDEYLEVVHQLLQYYKYEVQAPIDGLGSAPAGGKRTDAIPLVVNTQGWVKGLGEDLLRAIEAAAEPTRIFAFEQVDEPAATADGWTTSPVQQTHELPSSGVTFTLEPAPVSPLHARYTAADMRALTTIAYLHARLERPHHWDFSAPLLAVPPVQVELGGALQRAYLIGEGADAVVPSDLPLALNASLVALIDGEADGEAYVPARAQPPADEASFLGLALVRAVRAELEGTLSLQLVTPLSSAHLARVSALVRNGAFELPPCGMFDWRERVPGGGVSDEGLAGVRWDDVPFLDAGASDAVGGDRRRFRRNLQRKNM